MMTAQIIPIQQSTPAQLKCTSCGATADAACGCGAAYAPANAHAARGIKADPNKSDRAIAAETGVSHTTVQNARKATGKKLPVGGQPLGRPKKSAGKVESRTGRDGKTRRMPVKPQVQPSVMSSDPVQEDCADCQTEEQRWQRSLSNMAGDAIAMRAYWSREFGKWEKFSAPSSLVTLAKQAATAWSKLASDLAKK